MKKIAALVLVLLMSSSSFANCMAACPHRFFFGLEFLDLNLNTTFQNIRVKGNKFFYGVHLGYEYIAPWSFYAGAELFSTGAAHNFSVTQNNIPLTQNNSDSAFGNAEFRFGYTFAPKKWLLSPFLGFGGYGIEPLSNNNNFTETLPYLVAGIRAKYYLSCSYTFGVNGKIFRTVNGQQSFETTSGLTTTTYLNKWGGEIGLPFTWIFSNNRKWDFQIEPYVLALSFAEQQMAYGTRLLIGYRF